MYECFDETIALLKKNGFVPFHEDEDLTLIRLEIYDGKYEDGFTCQDLDVLAELKPYVVLNNYNYHKDGYDFVYGTVLVNGPAYESYYDIYIPRTIFEQYFH